MLDSNQWESPFNSFNSWKILFHADRIMKIRKWRCKKYYHKVSLPPPVSVTIDPTNRCNQNCIWCLYKGWKEKPENQVDIPVEKFIELIKFLKKWGVKSICFAGGGEPFVYDGMEQLLRVAGELNFDIGVITNGGIYLSNWIIDLLAKYNSFVGFSIDAGTVETHVKLHKPKNKEYENSDFYIALDNMERLSRKISELNSKCRIGYKYLLTPYNCDEDNIENAFSHAVDNGADDLHFRVAYFKYSDKKASRFSYDLKETFSLINRLRYEYRNSLNTYGITHKFDTKNLTEPRKNFSKCWLSPLALYFGADGNMWTCADTRGWENMCLGRWIWKPFGRMYGSIPENIESIVRKKWGTDVHRLMLDKICVDQCPRCTFSFYNELYENAVLEDNMTKNLI